MMAGRGGRSGIGAGGGGGGGVLRRTGMRSGIWRPRVGKVAGVSDRLESERPWSVSESDGDVDEGEDGERFMVADASSLVEEVGPTAVPLLWLSSDLIRR